MDSTHLHLLLNHFPVIGTLIAICLMGWAQYKNDNRLRIITSVLVIVLTLFAFVANKTGEVAEHSMGKPTHELHEIIEDHEHAAGPALIVHMLAGLFCIGYLVLQRRKLPMAKNVFIVCFALSVLAFGLMARAAWLGGKITHTELRG